MVDEKTLLKTVTYLESQEIYDALVAMSELLNAKKTLPDGMVLLRIKRVRVHITPSELRRHFIRRGFELFARIDPDIAELPEVKVVLGMDYYNKQGQSDG